MKKLKITVLRTDCRQELADEYGCEGCGKCPVFQEGQVFYTANSKPDGFCGQAWEDIHHYAFALTHGGGQETFFNGEWVRVPGVAITCCTDGIRPVTFKVEATNEEV